MYEIVAKTASGWEVIDTADTKKEKDYLVKEYRMAYGYNTPVRGRLKR